MLICGIVFSQTRDTPALFVQSPSLENDQQPVEHRTNSDTSIDLSTEEQPQPLRNNQFAPQSGFKFSYPLHEFGSPFHYNFNRPNYRPISGPPDLIRPINFPHYDGEINFFNKPTRNFHVRREFEDRGCRSDKEDSPRSLKFNCKTDLPREPNFHQRFDPGPDGFGPFGRKPQIIDTDFYKRPIVDSTDEPNIVKNEEEKKLSQPNLYEPPRSFGNFRLNQRPIFSMNQMNDFGIFGRTSQNNERSNLNVNRNRGVSKQNIDDSHPKLVRNGPNTSEEQEKEQEIRSFNGDNDEIEDNNNSSQDQYSRRRGWHPSRPRH